MYFIQEDDKPKIINKLFLIVKLENDKIILPTTGEELTEKQAEKLALKTNKILEQTNCKKVVLSKKMKKQEYYKNQLYSYSVNILDGKKLFEVLLNKIVDYIIEKKKMQKQEISISILINDFNMIMQENIKEMIKQYKKINIVTNHLEKFKKLEEKVLKEEGIAINVSNNKRKSLSKSQIILNIDFPEELINKYNIYEESIIVNLKGNVKINKKRFNGMNIHDYEIDYEDFENYDYEKDRLYQKKDLYEEKVYMNQQISIIQAKMKKDKVKIAKLVGERNTL